MNHLEHTHDISESDAAAITQAVTDVEHRLTLITTTTTTTTTVAPPPPSPPDDKHGPGHGRKKGHHKGGQGDNND